MSYKGVLIRFYMELTLEQPQLNVKKTIVSCIEAKKNKKTLFPVIIQYEKTR